MHFGAPQAPKFSPAALKSMIFWSISESFLDRFSIVILLSNFGGVGGSSQILLNLTFEFWGGGGSSQIFTFEFWGGVGPKSSKTVLRNT